MLKITQKILKWFLIITSILFLSLIWLGYFLFKKPHQMPIIPETQITTINKWTENTEFTEKDSVTLKQNITQQNNQQKRITMIEKNWIFYGLNGLGYYQKELKKEENKPTSEELAKRDPEAAKLNPLEIEDKIKDPEKIENYQERINHQQEPVNLNTFVFYPFDRWNDQAITYDQTNLNAFAISSFDIKPNSLLASNIKIEKNNNNNTITIQYQGPQKLIEEDKDYYLGEAWIPYTRTFTQYNNYPRKDYYFHFNPVRNILSLYTEKLNTQEKKL